VEPCELTVHELLDGYAARSFTPREVVESCARRIEALNPSLGAFTTLCLDRALAEADDPRPGPLCGVPFAAKDLFDTAGVRTTYGSRIFESHVPDRDAALVAWLRDAGAILVGKTQTHEFAWGITSVNDAMGSSRNPWDLARVPGGSSGGSGVALAARMVPLALGTDTGGSIRIPAAFGGVTGLKPTYGRLDAGGAFPLAPSLDHAGPMARTPLDLWPFVEPTMRDPESAHNLLTSTTIVTCPDLHLAPLSPAVERVLSDALRTFERLGARVEERTLAHAERIDEVFRVTQLVEAARVHREAGLYPERADDYGKDVRTRLEHAVATDPAEYARVAADRELVRASFNRLLDGGALLVTPVSGVPPVVAAEDRSPAGREFRAAVLPLTVPHNVVGIPACTVRAGFDELGLPVGLQIAAAQWRDEDTLGAAGALYTATPEIQGRWP
jgi:aspartyl-tRNA(Asn)/glutamyl-tRNA(Gln) amidotransferase subunit A